MKKKTSTRKTVVKVVKNYFEFSMIEIPANFSSKCEIKCDCGVKEDMDHIYNCKLYNMKKPEIPFEKIFRGNLNEQIMVFKKFSQNMERKK